jgi:N-methylhydantoinase B
MKIDSVSRDVFQHEVVSVAEEMSTALRRSAYSAIIWDMIDYACGLLDPQGNTIAQAPTIPAQLGIMPTAFRHMIQAIPLEQWHEGDVIICNDPYLGCTHTPDLVLFSPVYFDGKLIAITSTVAHHIDVGGRVPGSESATALEIFEEGLRIPPLKLMSRGEPNDTLFQIFARNVRDPKASTGDINAQVAACRTGERRLKELVTKYGADGFSRHVAAVFDYSESFVRSALKTVAATSSRAEIFTEDDAASDEPMRLAVTVTVDALGLTVDFTGTSAQRRNGLNSPYASTISMVHYAVKVVFTPDLPQNEGCNRPIRIIVPEGSILNPKEPAAVSVRHLTQQAVADVVLKALSSIAPTASTAGCQISFPTFVIGGFDHRAAQVARNGGEAPYFVVTDIIGGGMGASAEQDGISGVDTHGGNCAILSAEVLETTGPVRAVSTRLVPGSGGRGVHDGGLAIEREYEMLSSGLVVSGYTQQTRPDTAPWGLEGGESGGLAAVHLIRRNGLEEPLKSKFVAVPLEQGERLRLRAAGGAGWGRMEDKV